MISLIFIILIVAYYMLSLRWVNIKRTALGFTLWGIYFLWHIIINIIFVFFVALSQYSPKKYFEKNVGR